MVKCVNCDKNTRKTMTGKFEDGVSRKFCGRKCAIEFTKRTKLKVWDIHLREYVEFKERL